MKVKCSRCGKEIKSSDVKYLVYFSSTLEGNNNNKSYWCEDCYDSFIGEMEKPMPAFKDIKPALTDPKVKEIIKNIMGREKQKNIPIETYSEEEI